MELPQSCLIDPLEFAFSLESIFDPPGLVLIHNVTQEEKLSIYGYQTQKTRFFKIEVYNAGHIKKLAELSLQGVCGFHFQPYEAHIDTFQHFFSEYGLSGMEWMTIEKATFRSDLSTHTGTYPKATKSEIECDCFYFNIQKKMQNIGSEFGCITLPPVYKIWKVFSNIARV